VHRIVAGIVGGIVAVGDIAEVAVVFDIAVAGAVAALGIAVVVVLAVVALVSKTVPLVVHLAKVGVPVAAEVHYLEPVRRIGCKSFRLLHPCRIVDKTSYNPLP